MTEFEDKISLMIPAYLRGDLGVEDRAEVDAALLLNPSLKEDLEFQRSLRDDLQARRQSDLDAPADELGWHRLSRDLDKIDRASSSALPLTAFDDGAPELAAPQRPANDPAPARPWKAAAVALALVCVAQLGLLTVGGQSASEPSLYAPVSALVADAQVKIGLSDGLTASELTERLTDLNGQIVSGPSALGLYTIGFEDASACDAALPGLADIADVPSGCG
jgi:hypothetical protein